MDLPKVAVSAIAVLTVARKLGVALRVDGDKLVATTEVGPLPATLLAMLKGAGTTSSTSSNGVIRNRRRSASSGRSMPPRCNGTRPCSACIISSAVAGAIRHSRSAGAIPSFSMCRRAGAKSG